MTPDDRTRLAPPTDDQTRPLTGGDDTMNRTAEGTPSAVRAVSDSGDPSATILRVTESHDAEPVAPSFEHYQLQGELGRGGMGVVYKALDTQFMRDVAIKVLSDRLVGNPTAERRFLEEARVTGQLPHTAIPPVHQIGRLPDGRQFLVMKLIEGQTFGERLKARAGPTDGLAGHLSVLEQVCLGVGYAHSRGVIHRDLKPANIMVGAFGEVQVMDWGLAKEVRHAAHRERVSDNAFAVADDPAPAADPPAPPDTVLRDVRPTDQEFTRAGTILGTPPYMSPEQATGDPEAVDARTDVFSLGAVLCVILTGQPPYTGKTANEVVLKAINWETADAFRRLGMCRVDPAVVDLCKRCLAKEPAQRPANGAAVATELAEIRASAVERLRRADLSEMARIAKQQELKKRRRMQLALGVAVAGIVATAGVAWWYVSDQDRKAVDAAQKRNGEDDRAAKQREVDAANARAEEANKQAAAAKEAGSKRVAREAVLWAAIQQVETALGDVRTARDDAKWDAALERARAGLTLAEQRLLDAPEFESADRVRHLGEKLKVATTQRVLAAKLGDIACTFLERGQISDRNPAFADRYQNAFRFAGYSESDPANFAQQLSEHPVPAALVEAVFDWHHHAAANDRKSLATLLDLVIANNPFLVKWWAAQKDASAAGTKALLTHSADKSVGEQPAWVIHRLFCDLWHRGEREVAVRLMRAALVRYPSDYRLHLRFTLHLGVLNTPAARTEAIAHATAAVALQPKLQQPNVVYIPDLPSSSETAYILLGRLVAEQTGDPADALPYLDRAIALKRWESVSAHTERAAVYAKLNRLKDAEAEYAEINRKNATIESQLGEVRTRWAKGDRDAAVKELKVKMLTLVPSSADGQLALARTCRGMYLHAEAEAAFRSAVTAAPKRLEPRLELARYLEQQGQSADRVKKLQEVEKVLAAAAADFPAEFLPRWELVFVYEQLGEREKALAAGQEAARVGKGISDAEYILGYAQLVAGRSADATATAEQFGKAYPNDWRGPNLLALVAGRQWRRKDAVTHYEQAIKLSPTNAMLWNNLGAQYAYQLDSTNAVKAFAEAVRLEPNNALYHQNLGFHLGLLGDKRGVEHLVKAKELNPALKDAAPPK